ncbi:GHKL domain-containing protein [Streptococcus uberis]|nr:GHKL domain-containing protein [Streptococcus uberis]MCK1200147.1 GHKL domain-containing protein [Streptococcus uberis]
MTTIVNAIILSVIVFLDYYVIFSKVSGIKLTLWRMLFIFSIFTICHGFVHRNNLFDPLLFLGVSFLFDRDREWSEHLFNSFFTTLLIEMMYRLIAGLLLPSLFGHSYDIIRTSFGFLSVVYIILLPAIYLLLYMFSIDLSLFKLMTSVPLKRRLYFTNLVMVGYYLLFHVLMLMDISVIDYLQKYRMLLIMIYMLFMTWIFLTLNRFAKDKLQEKLHLAHSERIENLKRYNNYIEMLYQQIRTVKHDSENIMISLKDSVDNGDLDTITYVYNNVVRASGNAIVNVGENFGSLDNIKESVIRSLINSKLIEAQQQGIRVYIEIPDDIEENCLKLMDLISVITYLLDNAIETAKGSQNPFLSIAYFCENQKQYFIIENSTKVKRINLMSLFDKYYIEKGECLSLKAKQFNDILEENPQLIFSTKSDYFRMRQMLEMETLDEHFYS